MCWCTWSEDTIYTLTISLSLPPLTKLNISVYGIFVIFTIKIAILQVDTDSEDAYYMPVSSMSAGSWEGGQLILTSTKDMSVSRQTHGTRSQDDATVGYSFQRSQSDNHMSGYSSKRWAIGDDSVIEQVSSICTCK